jgi:hypothetical protein
MNIPSFGWPINRWDGMCKVVPFYNFQSLKGKSFGYVSSIGNTKNTEQVSQLFWKVRADKNLAESLKIFSKSLNIFGDSPTQGFSVEAQWKITDISTF